MVTFTLLEKSSILVQYSEEIPALNDPIVLHKKKTWFFYVLVRTFEQKKLLPPQKLTKNLLWASRSMTWPPHLQFASYTTVLG